MSMSMGEPMDNCTSQQGQTALCIANPFGHSVWQNFLHVKQQKLFGALFAVQLLGVGFFVGRGLSNSPPLLQYLRIKINKSLSIVDAIRRALSSGIIQPQIYELAIG